MKKKADPPPKKLPAAALEERRRISRELHDRALQMLSTVRLRAEICRRELMHNPPALEKELQTIEETTEKAITEIRNLLAETQSWRDLKAGSLERRLKEELDIFRARTGFKLEFVCAIRVRHLPYDMERELYFTLREGILTARALIAQHPRKEPRHGIDHRERRELAAREHVIAHRELAIDTERDHALIDPLIASREQQHARH